MSYSYFFAIYYNYNRFITVKQGDIMEALKSKTRIKKIGTGLEDTKDKRLMEIEEENYVSKYNSKKIEWTNEVWND